MALDKQRILNELGSVMNQLQSADCGCIGKLFSNSDQGSINQAPSKSPFTGCNHGAHHCHGYCMNRHSNYGNADASAGEPNSANMVYNNNNNANMNRPCMGGQCNPAKLYSDTYNYLNHNLMQPVVREVYNDLKSISPTNTVMNNPLASKMGLSQQNPSVKPVIEGNMGNVFDPNKSQMTKNDNIAMMPHRTQNQGSSAHNYMAGMGPQIVKMVMGEGKSAYSNMQADRSEVTGIQNQQKLAESGVVSNYEQPLVDAQMANTNASYGFQKNSNMNTDTSLQQQFPTNQLYYNQQGQSIANSNLSGQQFFTQQNLGKKQDQEMTNPNSQQLLGQQGQGITPASLAGQQAPAATHNQSYGIHSQGMSKFNEMFPGVAQSDLGFDPMAIAIQMNPANQQQAAMNTMQKLISNNSAMRNTFNTNPNVVTQQQVPPQQQSIVPQTILAPVPQQNTMACNQEQKNVAPYSSIPEVGYQQEIVKNQYNSNDVMQQHQVYQTQAPVTYQPDNTQEQISQQRGYMQQGDSVQQGNIVQQKTQEPLLPVDTSKNNYDAKFNTLGQSVEMIPGKIYQSSIPPVPQTLSPQPISPNLSADPSKYSNVKSTVSKTSLIGRRLGKNPSRSQLQHVYNQYKGSQSYTQQNVTSNNDGGRYSDVQLRPPAERKPMVDELPIERTGGDTFVKNQTNSDNQFTRKEVTGHIGDVPICNKPHSDTYEKPQSSKCRNGLQDMVYTSYPTSAAWTFSGKNRPFVSPTRAMLRSRSPVSRNYMV